MKSGEDHILAVALVWTAEALNTAIEQLRNRVSSGHDPLIMIVKDVPAGAVPIMAVGAALIGAATFLPYVQRAAVAPSSERTAG